MGKTTLLTPVYMSVAWTLMTTYQLFTDITVSTLIIFICKFNTTIGVWLSDRLDLIVFIHSFAWIFLLSSFIPAVLLGKKRGVLVQFGVCLTLAVLANIVQGAVTDVSSGPLDQIFGLAPLFRNPAVATAYMVLPYFLMAWFDIRGKRKTEELKKLEMENNDFSEDLFTVENDFGDKEKIQEEHIPAN